MAYLIFGLQANQLLSTQLAKYVEGGSSSNSLLCLDLSTYVRRSNWLKEEETLNVHLGMQLAEQVVGMGFFIADYIGTEALSHFFGLRLSFFLNHSNIYFFLLS